MSRINSINSTDSTDSPTGDRDPWLPNRNHRHSVAASVCAVLSVVAVVFGPQVYFDHVAASYAVDDDGPPSYSLDSEPTVRCPDDPWAEVWGGAPEPRGNLVPGTPTKGLVCAYAAIGQHVTAQRPLSVGDMAELVRHLNHLAKVPAGAINCPNDDGSGYAVILSDGSALTTVSIQRTGCGFVFSRNRASRSDGALLALLSSLARPDRTIRGSLAG